MTKGVEILSSGRIIRICDEDSDVIEFDTKPAGAPDGCFAHVRSVDCGVWVSAEQLGAAVGILASSMNGDDRSNFLNQILRAMTNAS